MGGAMRNRISFTMVAHLHLRQVDERYITGSAIASDREIFSPQEFEDRHR
jgi:hypothetical protein